MKIVAIIPIKTNSKRIKSKNFKKINKKPLYKYLLDKLKYSDFDEIYVDSDSKEIEKYCKKNKFIFIRRLKKLATDQANGNDLLNYHAKIIKADVYFQLFITAPLLSIKTINKCIKILRTNNNFDSIFTINEIYSWFWFKNKPVNYNPRILPRSQDAKPIIRETTGLYGIRRQSILKSKCRIGKKPYLYNVSEIEGLDIDTNNDLRVLKLFLKK